MALWGGRSRPRLWEAAKQGRGARKGSLPASGGIRLSSSSLLSLTHSYNYVLGKETFLMHWPVSGDVEKKELLGQLEEFAEYMSTQGCKS